MPQLMPLLWWYSMFISFLLILVLVEMFFYKENFYLSESGFYNLIDLSMYKW